MTDGQTHTADTETTEPCFSTDYCAQLNAPVTLNELDWNARQLSATRIHNLHS